MGGEYRRKHYTDEVGIARRTQHSVTRDRVSIRAHRSPTGTDTGASTGFKRPGNGNEASFGGSIRGITIRLSDGWRAKLNRVAAWGPVRANHRADAGLHLVTPTVRRVSFDKIIPAVLGG
jgi:hypothetical protein